MPASREARPPLQSTYRGPGRLMCPGRKVRCALLQSSPLAIVPHTTRNNDFQPCRVFAFSLCQLSRADSPSPLRMISPPRRGCDELWGAPQVPGPKESAGGNQFAIRPKTALTSPRRPDRHTPVFTTRP